MPSLHNILPNEMELFVSISKGDEAAFTQVFYHYEPRIYPFVFNLTGSQVIAEEVVQEVFIKLWNKREMAADIQNPRAYIFRMAANKVTNHLRTLARKAKAENYLTALQNDEHNATEEAVQLKEMQQLISQAVEQLPPQRKLIYKLSRQEGLKNEEIAIKLNLSLSTVKNQLSTALNAIREHLQKYPGGVLLLLILLKD